MLFDSPYVCLPVNARGRDFCIGDLHGCLQMLQSLLEAVRFDPLCDRIFSVGDLIHRGPNSAACLCLAEQPWFFPVLGNHEVMQISAYAGECWVEDSKLETGLEYLADADPKAIAREHERYQHILSRLPLALETELPDGRKVGVVHAGLPSPYNWADVRALYRRHSNLETQRQTLQAQLLWDRQTAAAAIAAAGVLDSHQPGLSIEERRRLALSAWPVVGIDMLLSGHTQMPNGFPLWAGKRVFLDTGAGWADGLLSIMNLSTADCWQVADPRENPRLIVRRLGEESDESAAITRVSEAEIAQLATSQNASIRVNHIAH